MQVHVVHSNHLDVGYTDLDSTVINLYFREHLPRAARLAAEMRWGLHLTPTKPTHT